MTLWQIGNVVFAQAGGEAAPAAGQQATSPQPTSPLGSFTMFIPIIAIMIVFMWMSSRSQKKRDTQRRLMIDNVKPKDRVVTIGGLYGRVVSVKGNKLVLCVDENKDVRVTVNKSAISRPLKEGEDEAEGDESA
jgi:preprotein translocase subunit YajC